MKFSFVERLWQCLLIATVVCFSWLTMQAVHEFGHVLHAWLSGGTVVGVVLHPFQISRTDVAPDPHPQFVAWGGPVWGSLVPLALFAIVRWRKWPRAWLAAFFAGFCLIGNGGYLLGGSFYPVGDAEVLLREGAARIALAGFGAAAMGGGLCLWNGLGGHFGLGPGAGPIDRGAAVWTAAATAIVAGVELALAC